MFVRTVDDRVVTRRRRGRRCACPLRIGGTCLGGARRVPRFAARWGRGAVGVRRPRRRLLRGCLPAAPLFAALAFRRLPLRCALLAAAAALDRLRPFVRVRFEARDDLARHLAPDHPLDVGEQRLVVRAHEGDRLAGGARPARAADPVDVVFRHVGQVEVDDVRQLLDVEAARGDVGGDERLQLAGLELRQRVGPRVLALVAVDRQRGHAVLAQVLGEPVRAMLGAREHQHLVPLLFADELGEQFRLAAAVDEDHLLAHRFHGGVARRRLDGRRVLQQGVRERADLVGERRREQQRLPLLRQQREHALHVGQEAHVQHAVGLVEHEHLDLRQVDRLLSGVVEQAARRGDDDVDSALERRDLVVDRHAAEDDGDGGLLVLAVVAHALLDLRREFARRREDQRAHRVARLARGGLRQREPMQDRQHEAGGLAGAGLRAGEQVATCEHQRNGLLLDGSGFGVAEFGDSANECLGQAEGVES